jgi:hypothetical protein
VKGGERVGHKGRGGKKEEEGSKMAVRTDTIGRERKKGRKKGRE